MRLIFLALVFLLGGCASNHVGPKPLHSEELNDAWYKNDSDGYRRAKLWANEYAIYAILAYDVYDKSVDEYVPIPFPTNERFVRILPCEGLEADLGFRAKAWLRYEDISGLPELLIVYRGTNFTEVSDWTRGNLAFIKGLYRTQFDAALEFAMQAKQYLNDTGTEVSGVKLIGHSLGGGLAEYVQRQYKKSQAIAFDSSPNTGVIYSLFSHKEDKDVVRLHEFGEILQFIRPIVSPDFKFDNKPEEDDIKTIWIDFFRSNPFVAHDMRDFAMKLLQAATLSTCPDVCPSQSAVNVIEQVKLGVDNNSTQEKCPLPSAGLNRVRAGLFAE